MARKKVLVVDDDQEIADLIETTLIQDNYEVVRAVDGVEGLDLARSVKPDMVITDVEMPRMNGLALCRNIRQDKDLRLIPIVMLTGSRTHPYDRIAGLKIGADDYILKPFLPQELSIRINRLISRTEEQLSVNPLTKLPGSYTLENEVAKRLENKELFAACYFDIDNFKAFNDHYGYKWGDEIIKFFADTIKTSLNTYGNERDFVIHIGGDDFIALTTPNKAETICNNVVKTFSDQVTRFYSDDDLKRGFITTVNRRGQSEEFQLLSLSIAIACNDNKPITHYAMMVDILGELKRFAKSKQGNYIVRDRRKE